MILSAYKFVLSPLLNSPHNFVHVAYVVAKSLCQDRTGIINVSPGPPQRERPIHRWACESELCPADQRAEHTAIRCRTPAGEVFLPTFTFEIVPKPSVSKPEFWPAFWRNLGEGRAYVYMPSMFLSKGIPGRSTDLSSITPPTPALVVIHANTQP